MSGGRVYRDREQPVQRLKGGHVTGMFEEKQEGQCG